MAHVWLERLSGGFLVLLGFLFLLGFRVRYRDCSEGLGNNQ